MAEAKISVAAMRSRTTALQSGAYRSILETTGASTPPTTRVSTMLSRPIEFAVISAERGRMLGITEASAGPKSCPTAEKTSVITRRWMKSPLMPGIKEPMGINATAAARPRLDHSMICFRSRRSAITPAGGAKRTAGKGDGRHVPPAGGVAPAALLAREVKGEREDLFPRYARRRPHAMVA